jgi:hypothetical protein
LLKRHAGLWFGWSGWADVHEKDQADLAARARLKRNR